MYAPDAPVTSGLVRSYVPVDGVYFSIQVPPEPWAVPTGEVKPEAVGRSCRILLPCYRV